MAEIVDQTSTLPDPDDERVRLQDLTAQATMKYSIKDYNAAAELYSQATELQAQINGEMSSQNADLLYAYGRCLYHVAVRNSDVLGSKVAGENQQDATERQKSKKQPTNQNSIATASQNGEPTGNEVPTKGDAHRDTPGKENDIKDQDAKPYFRFTGDENWDDSDAEGDEEAEDEEAADEEDDFATAFEVLDLARVLLLKNLDEAQPGEPKEPERPNDTLSQFKERLADTYDLQAEISLEGERFANAVDDLRASLNLKKELFRPESSLIAEAHYKLSLALEFSSVKQQSDEHEAPERGQLAQIDKAMREEAATEMEAAIASCRLRISKEEAKLRSELNTSETSSSKPKPTSVTQQEIDDVRDMVNDMEQRLIELRRRPISIDDPSGVDMTNGSLPLGGVLASMLGESAAAQQAKLDEASKGAKDLTSLVVKKRKPVTEEQQADKVAEPSKASSKRKVEFAEEVTEVGTGKKARLLEGDKD